MGALTLGTWRNPPLAYVVAEVVISTHYGIGKALPEIQESLRALFPRTQESVGLTFQMGDNGAAPTPISESVWQLLTVDQSQGVHLSGRSISLHATKYQNFSAFEEVLGKVLDAIQSAKLGAFVESLGLRYIDYIIPSEGRSTREYVVDHIKGVDLSSLEAASRSSIWAGTYSIEDCEVNARVATPAPAGMMIPPNFTPLPLEKPKPMLDAEKTAAAGGAFGFIDTDCTKKVMNIFDASAIKNDFSSMHENIAVIFKALRSELAKKEWE